MYLEESSTESKIPKEELKPEEQPKFEERDISKPDYKFVPGNHLWKQEGYYAVCYGCELSHAVWLGPDKLIVGVDDKGPIIKTRAELGMV